MTRLECECGNDEFRVNGWEVTQDMLEDYMAPRDYKQRDVGKADVVELLCPECGKHYMTI